MTGGDIAVIAVLLVAVFFAARSLWKKQKQGGCAGCSCGCSECSGGCSGCCGSELDKK